MADTKFTILGMTGAGKTCYLLGMYYEMCSGFEGYTILADDDDDVELRKRYNRMLDFSLGPDRFPPGTDSSSNFKFDFQYGYKNILSFDWLDYAGGILETKNSGDSLEYSNFIESLNSSSCLFICIDGDTLIADTQDQKIRNIKNDSKTINNFISKFQKGNQTLPPIALVITKFDKCAGTISTAELFNIVKAAYTPLFLNTAPPSIVSIIPISIGLNLEDEKDAPQLLNMHLPIFMGIYCALTRKLKELTAYQNKNQEAKAKLLLELDKWNDLRLQYTAQKNKLENSFLALHKNNKIHEMKNALTSASKNINQVNHEIFTIDKAITETDQQIQSLHLNQQTLLEELNANLPLFINGIEKSFTEFQLLL
ncbi:hypothetical protein [Candidatus Epulonipiscium viviparus]|uniref:hypothetical protein n=1 Tax=Candidatus Epulonipiscium viviparus TaxID=420336 RepID=UPI0027380F77|nr:hypothetical protein [Candidatus Epulopiscium viviparus]